MANANWFDVILNFFLLQMAKFWTSEFPNWTQLVLTQFWSMIEQTSTHEKESGEEYGILKKLLKNNELSRNLQLHQQDFCLLDGSWKFILSTWFFHTCVFLKKWIGNNHFSRAFLQQKRKYPPDVPRGSLRPSPSQRTLFVWGMCREGACDRACHVMRGLVFPPFRAFQWRHKLLGHALVLVGVGVSKGVGDFDDNYKISVKFRVIKLFFFASVTSFRKYFISHVEMDKKKRDAQTVGYQFLFFCFSDVINSVMANANWFDVILNFFLLQMAKFWTSEFPNWTQLVLTQFWSMIEQTSTHEKESGEEYGILKKLLKNNELSRNLQLHQQDFCLLDGSWKFILSTWFFHTCVFLKKWIGNNHFSRAFLQQKRKYPPDVPRGSLRPSPSQRTLFVWGMCREGACDRACHVMRGLVFPPFRAFHNL